jgi:WD40 repeat protein
MDTSVKLADVEKMKAHGDKKDHDHMDDGASRNVTRSFYDHSSVRTSECVWPTPCRVAHSGDGCTHSWSVQTVTDVCFHPTTPLLASCSKDMSIKFFDYSKTHAKRSVKFIQVTGHATHTIALSSTLTFCYFHTGCGPTSINRLPPVGYRSMRQPQRAQTLFFFLRTWAD